MNKINVILRAKIIYLKTAITILPEDGIDANGSLLIEIGKEAVSFLLFNKEPLEATALLSYHLQNSAGYNNRAAMIREIVEATEALRQDFSSTYIAFDTAESTLMPRSFYKEEQLAQVAETMFGKNKLVAVTAEHIRQQDITNVYRVENDLLAVLKNLFPFATNYHSSTLLAKGLINEGVTCIIGYSSIRIVIFDQGLKFLQSYEYNTAADIIYHLLNVSSQFSLNPDTMSLSLCGMISEHSHLYDEVYKYFRHITFGQLPNNFKTSIAFEAQPTHFFSHLISMASCVS